MKRLFLLIAFVGMAYSAFAQNSTTIVNIETGESFEVTVPDGITITMSEENWEDSVKAYIEKARWGDDMSRLKLADCYHYGRGVKPSFVNMLATFTSYGRYGEKILKDYLTLSDENDPFRLVYEVMEHADTAKIHKLTRSHPAYAKALKAMVLSEEGKEVEAISLLNEAVSEGCDVAKTLMYVYYEKKGDADACESFLIENANENPAFYNLLSGIYMGNHFPDSGKKEKKKAVECYINADKYAFLTQRGAYVLIKYYQEKADKGNPICDAAEMERLKKFAEYKEN